MTASNTSSNNATIGREIRQSLKGKVAFITGVTGVLGGEVAKEFARRGARLILHYNSRIRKAIELELALKMTGADVTIVQADYSQSLDLRDLVHIVSTQVDRIDYLVHTAGICRKFRQQPPMPDPESDAMNRINQIAPIEITLGLEEKSMNGSVILYVGSAIEDFQWHGAGYYGESKSGLHHFAAQYADTANRRGIRTIYYMPGVFHEEARADVRRTLEQEALLKLGQTELLRPSHVARNIVSSMVNEQVHGVDDAYEGRMLVRRDGYRV